VEQSSKVLQRQESIPADQGRPPLRFRCDSRLPRDRSTAQSCLVKRHLSGGCADVVPVEGWPAGLRFDGQASYLWWGRNFSDRDCAATRAGRLLTFASEADCWAETKAAGWAPTVEPADAEPAAVADLEPAQEWLRGQRPPRTRCWLRAKPVPAPPR
jgi:hypothetical protein